MGKKKKSQKQNASQSAAEGESRRNFLKLLPYITPVVLTFQLGEEVDAAKNKRKNKNKNKNKKKRKISPLPKDRRTPPPPPSRDNDDDDDDD